MKALVILFTFMSSIGSISHAAVGEKMSIKGLMTSHDSVNIPDGPGYEFQIDGVYTLTATSQVPENGLIIRKYHLDASFPGASPATSYLGKSLLLISNEVENICAKVGTRNAHWKNVDLTTFSFFAGDSLLNHLSLDFSCFDRD